MAKCCRFTGADHCGQGEVVVFAFVLDGRLGGRLVIHLVGDVIEGGGALSIRYGRLPTISVLLVSRSFRLVDFLGGLLSHGLGKRRRSDLHQPKRKAPGRSGPGARHLQSLREGRQCVGGYARRLLIPRPKLISLSRRDVLSSTTFCGQCKRATLSSRPPAGPNGGAWLAG